MNNIQSITSVFFYLTYLEASNSDPHYSASCVFYRPLDAHSVISSFYAECCVATFSNSQNFDIVGLIDIIKDDLCQDDFLASHVSTMSRSIAVVTRGNCTFEKKCTNAAFLGYSASVIVNYDENIFPPGSINDSLLLNSPCVMVGKSFYELYSNLCSREEAEKGYCPVVSGRLSYGMTHLNLILLLFDFFIVPIFSSCDK